MTTLYFGSSPRNRTKWQPETQCPTTVATKMSWLIRKGKCMFRKKVQHPGVGFFPKKLSGGSTRSSSTVGWSGSWMQAVKMYVFQLQFYESKPNANKCRNQLWGTPVLASMLLWVLRWLFCDELRNPFEASRIHHPKNQGSLCRNAP